MDAPLDPDKEEGKKQSTTSARCWHAAGHCMVISEVPATEFPGLLEGQVMQAGTIRFLAVPGSKGERINILWMERTDAATVQQLLPDTLSVPVVYIAANPAFNAATCIAGIAENVGDRAQDRADTKDIYLAATLAGVHAQVTQCEASKMGAELLQQCVTRKSSRKWALLSLPQHSDSSEEPIKKEYTDFLFGAIVTLLPRHQDPSNFIVEVGTQVPPELNMLPALLALLRASPPCMPDALIEQRLGALCFSVQAAPTVFWSLHLLLRGGWLNHNNLWLEHMSLVTLLQVRTVRNVRLSDAERPVIYKADLRIDVMYYMKFCCVCYAPLKGAVCAPCKPLKVVAYLPAVPKKVGHLLDLDFRLPSPLCFAARFGELRLVRRLASNCVLHREQFQALKLAALNGHEQVTKELVELWGGEATSEVEQTQDMPRKSLMQGRRLSRLAEDLGYSRIAVCLSTAEHRLAFTSRTRAKKAKADEKEKLKREVAKDSKEEKQDEKEVKKADADTISEIATLLKVNYPNIYREVQPKKDAPKPLESAVRSSDVDGVNTCLSRGADPNTVCDKAATVLHLAAERGCPEITQALLAAGARVGALTDDMETPLQHAAMSRWGAANVPLLVAAGASVNSVSRYGNSPLLDACAKGSAASAEALLRAGAILKVTNRNTETPLLVAAAAGHAEVVTTLLKANANPSEADMWHSLAPLHAASRNGHAATVSALLAGGANVNQLSKHGTPIVLACNFGHADVARLLVDGGANIDSPWDGRSPLHRACRKGRLPLVQRLIEAGAKLNLGSEEGYTELHFATAHDNGIVEMLLAAGSRPTTAAVDGTTPLHIACMQGSRRVVESLLYMGADPDACTTAGLTPLHLAARRGHASVAEMLLYYGAVASPIAKDGSTPLHLAAALSDSHDIVRVLLAAGAVADVANNLGETPLHLAIDDKRTVLLLVAAGAHAGRRDLKGQQPAERAAGKVASMLEAAAITAMYAHPRKLC